jgi:DNA mismatch endonuclease (patch repair protein)
MDRITNARRSWNMSRIRGCDTGPERAVRSILHRLGYRFRLHQGDLPGRPDIVLPRYKTVIFVHGCFWHRHEGCKFSYTPKTNKQFWQSKFNENIQRDSTANNRLLKLGWHVITAWECELLDRGRLSIRLQNRLKRYAKVCAAQKE